MFYDAHVKLSGKSVKKLSQNSRAQGTENAVIKTAERTGSQGWIGRNCTLSVANGALNVHPDATSAVPFLALTGLDLDGPVTAILRVRCPSGEHGDWSWRVRGNKEFGEGQKTSFRLAATSDWQVIKVELPSKDHLIHVRLAFTAKTNTDIASITLQGMNTSISYDWSEK